MVKILCDSSCDLSKSLIEEYGLTIIPFSVMLGDEEYKDGVTLSPQMIFDYVDKTGVLPKTAAINEFEFEEVFKQNENPDGIVCIVISDKLSVTYKNAVEASKKFDNVYIVDSGSLSSGEGIQAIYASILARNGFSAKEIAEKVEARKKNVQIGFATYKLNYLHKGGRCSSVQLLGANLLKIRPSIKLKDGRMEMNKKYVGNMLKVCRKYVVDTLLESPNPNKELVIITHASATEDIVDAVRDELNKNFSADRVEETVAGATVTSHCGENTIGIIYYNDNLPWDK